VEHIGHDACDHIAMWHSYFRDDRNS
jgi:hypothetical protein